MQSVFLSTHSAYFETHSSSRVFCRPKVLDFRNLERSGRPNIVRFLCLVMVLPAQKQSLIRLCDLYRRVHVIQRWNSLFAHTLLLILSSNILQNYSPVQRYCFVARDCVNVFVDAAEIRCVGDPHPGRSSGWTGGHRQNASGATSRWHHQWWLVNAHATVSLLSFLAVTITAHFPSMRPGGVHTHRSRTAVPSVSSSFLTPRGS